MEGERQERPDEWPDPPEEETEETEEAEKPDDPSLLVWELVTQKIPDGMFLMHVWRARTPVGWLVAASQILSPVGEDREGQVLETVTGPIRLGGEHRLVGFTFVPDFGSNNMTKNQWE